MDAIRDDRAFAAFAIAASLVLHILLVWLVFQLTVESVREPRPISVVLVRQRLPPLLKPVEVPKHVTASPPSVPKPILHAAPGQITHAKPQIREQQRSPAKRLTTQETRPGPPVMHFGAAGAEAGLGMDLGTPSGGGGNGHGSIDDFDDAVKQRIQDAKTYPPALPYMWNECAIDYRVTIDRNGNLLDYQLYGCGNPFLDSAARAAILMASPFPPPPDFGGNRYTVYGSLVFRPR